MNNRKPSHSGIFAIFVIGGLIGTALMLLFAPRSGKRTRKKLQRTSTRLRRQTIANAYLSTKRVSNFIHACLQKLTSTL